MMLHTDEQTITDLGIFGKRNNGGIFDLYNRTFTRGGEAILKEFFLHPLSNKEAIDHRSSIIGHFARCNYALPFDATLIDATEKYVKEPGEQVKHSRQQSVLSEKDIQLGVLAVIAIIQQSAAFVASAAVKGIATYATERNAIE